MSGVDFQKVLNKKLEMDGKAANTGTKKTLYVKTRYFKPTVGDNNLRIMPPWTKDTNNINANQFWREIWEHGNIGPEDDSSMQVISVLDPVKTPGGPGGRNPISEHCKQLYATNDPLKIEQAKALRSREKYVSNVVDLKDPVFTEQDVKNFLKDYPQVEEQFQVGETKVKVWQYSKTMFTNLLSIIEANEVDISDFSTGHDLTLNRKGTTKNDTEYTLTPKMKPSKFGFKGDFSRLAYDLDKVKQFVDASVMDRMITEGKAAFIKNDSTAALTGSDSPLE